MLTAARGPRSFSRLLAAAGRASHLQCTHSRPCPLQEEKVKALEALVEEAKELRESERDHLGEKSLDELGEMEVSRQLLNHS